MLVLFAQGQENIRMKSFLFKAILCEINGIQIGFVQYSQLIYTEYVDFIYHSDILYGRFEGDLLFSICDSVFKKFSWCIWIIWSWMDM